MQIDRETIINLAREAGLIDFRDALSSHYVQAVLDDIEHFAKLVAEHSASVEREACAKVCDWVAAEWKSDSKTAIDCAAAIRARGQ